MNNLNAVEADKHVWRPDVFGSVLFLVASAVALSALGIGVWRPQLRTLSWSITWLNMLGSVAFMVSAVASFVLPSSDTPLDLPLAQAGTSLEQCASSSGRGSCYPPGVPRCGRGRAANTPQDDYLAALFAVSSGETDWRIGGRAWTARYQ